MLATLFRQLHEYTAPNNLEFAEGATFPLIEIESWELSFDEGGTRLKKLIETVYTTGISSIENVQSTDAGVEGIFTDAVAPTLIKRYSFTITPKGIKYKLLNPESLDSVNYEELDFAASKMFGGSKKEKKCIKGTQCRNSCISPNKACSHELAPNDKGEFEWIKKQLDNKKGILVSIKDDIPDAQKEAIAAKVDEGRSPQEQIKPEPIKKVSDKEISAAKKALKSADMEYNKAATSAIKRGMNPDNDMSVIRALGKKYDAESKLEKLQKRREEEQNIDDRSSTKYDGEKAAPTTTTAQNSSNMNTGFPAEVQQAFDAHLNAIRSGTQADSRKAAMSMTKANIDPGLVDEALNNVYASKEYEGILQKQFAKYTDEDTAKDLANMSAKAASSSDDDEARSKLAAKLGVLGIEDDVQGQVLESPDFEDLLRKEYKKVLN